MRGKLVAMFVVGLVLGGLGMCVVPNQPEARGQAKEKKQAWEYQVVYSSTEGKDAAAAMTKRYNALAAEGWEYVGPVVDYTQARSPQGAYSGLAGTFVVFKRAK